MSVLIYDKVSIQLIGIEKKMNGVLAPGGLPISCNNTNFSECLVEGWTFNLKGKNGSLVHKMVSRRLKQMIPMILLHVGQSPEKGTVERNI